MNLAQRMPIGISLACLIMLNACSNDDPQAPEPRQDAVSTDSNLRVADGFELLPSFPVTQGSTGFNVYPLKWERNTTGTVSKDLQKLPTGTSSLTHVWGHLSNPWLQPLPTITASKNVNSMITLTTNASSWMDGDGKISSVKSKIKYLKPGKHYAITFYVASAIPTLQDPATNPVYAKTCQIGLAFSKPGGANGFVNYFVDLTGSNAKWVAKTIIYQAENTEAEILFSAFTPQPGQYSYVNVIVDKNSIKKID